MAPSVAVTKRTEAIQEVIALLEAHHIDAAKKALTKMVTKRAPRAPSAYNLFVGDAIKTQKKTMDEAVATWKGMSEADKEVWKNLAKEKKEEMTDAAVVEPKADKADKADKEKKEEMADAAVVEPKANKANKANKVSKSNTTRCGKSTI